MKIYMVEASWYDKLYEEYRFQNIAAFTSKESAQKYIDTFSEVNEAAGRRLDELLDKRGYKNGQAIDSNDKELYDAYKKYIPCDEVDLWISEYELRD